MVDRLRSPFFFFLFFFACAVPSFSGKPSVVTDPGQPRNGRALIFIFSGLDDGRQYSLDFGPSRGLKIPFRAAGDRTVVLAGVGVNASAAVRWHLRTGGRSILSNRAAIVRIRYKKSGFNVDPRFTEPPASLGLRLKEESRLMRLVRETCSTDCYYQGPAVLPVPLATGWSNDFGRMRVLNSVWTDVHSAADMTAAKGTPVHAFCGGRIALARPLYYGGNTVMIDHGRGVVSMYCHLSEFAVREGETVGSGDCLGLSGDTGCVTAAHLHFAVFIRTVAVNPIDLTGRMQALFGSAVVSDPCPPSAGK